MRHVIFKSKDVKGRKVMGPSEHALCLGNRRPDPMDLTAISYGVNSLGCRLGFLELLQHSAAEDKQAPFQALISESSATSFGIPI